MITYLKNMEGWKHKDLKSNDFDSIKELFNKALKRVNMFVDFRTKLVEGSSKRAGTELEQEVTKKQKVDDVQETAEVDNDQEAAKIKELMKIVSDEEEVEIDAIPLDVKPPSIVDWKIHTKRKKSYYQIIRADGKSQMYLVFSHMLKSFDREDLETLWKLKIQYGGINKITECWNGSYMTPVEYIFKDATHEDLYVGRKEISSYTCYNYWLRIHEVFGSILLGRIVGIKSLLNAVSITTALIDVNAAQSKVNAAGEEVSTAELVSAAYIKEFDLLKWDQHHRLKRLYKVGLTARVESSDNEESLGKDASKQGRIDAIDADEEITLVSVHDVNVSAGEEVFATTIDDITLAQVLEEMKSTKPKKKRIVLHELGESTTIISSQLSSQQSRDKGKGILIEPVKPMNKKDLIRLDEETALSLQAEFDKEERLAREKAKKEEEVNIDLIETWDDIQVKINADHQLAKRMQAQEQEELSIEEKATLFQQLLEKRRKHFAAKRAEEKRNKPPTKAQ
ncbi:hypothetical protein Tco_0778390 [Tanacetum coccineum]